LCPNNCGSTLIYKLLSTSPEVAWISNEGQNVEGYRGFHPNTKKSQVLRVWSKVKESISDETKYNWNTTKEAWAEAWYKDNSNATICVEKSPPNIYRADILAKEFPGSKFILMPRNPYAQIEGIMRKKKDPDLIEATNHALACLQQCRNLATVNSEYFITTYEDFTNDPQTVVNNLLKWLPGLKSLSIKSTFKIHGRVSPITNLNESQIKNLLAEQISTINSILSTDLDTMHYWKYDLIT
jgi:hypothetical protein